MRHGFEVLPCERTDTTSDQSHNGKEKMEKKMRAREIGYLYWVLKFRQMRHVMMVPGGHWNKVEMRVREVRLLPHVM